MSGMEGVTPNLNVSTLKHQCGNIEGVFGGDRSDEVEGWDPVVGRLLVVLPLHGQERL